MDELIQRIAQKFNLPEDTIKGVVQMVVDFLKEKLPAGIGSQVEGFLTTGELPKQAQGLFSGLFGKK